MGRKYRVSFEEITVTAVQDLFEINGAAGKMLAIRRVAIGASNQAPTAQMLSLRARFLPATVTSGSGGAAGTIGKTDPGDATASFTAEVNNTTKATTGGTAVVLGEYGVHVNAGYDEEFARPPIVGPSQAFVFELLAAPTGTLKLSGTIEVEEIG